MTSDLPFTISASTKFIGSELINVATSRIGDSGRHRHRLHLRRLLHDQNASVPKKGRSFACDPADGEHKITPAATKDANL
jgi:hypothetical protein